MNQTNAPYELTVDVRTEYLDEQSDPARDRYVFAYHITLSNTGQIGLMLLSRHWIISDGNGDTRVVRGEGVVGKQPRLQPGESFKYSSGAMLETPVGAMEGSYSLLADDGEHFDSTIPAFTLAMPNVLQ